MNGKKGEELITGGDRRWDFFLKVKRGKILYYVLYRLRSDSDVHYEQHEEHEENEEHEPCTQRTFCGHDNFANVVGSIQQDTVLTSVLFKV